LRVVLDWLTGLYPLWVELDPQAMYCATKVAAAELLLSGGTTSADHSFMAPGGDLEILETQIAACREIGLRLHLVVGSMPTLEGNLEELLKPALGERIGRLVDPEPRVYAIMESMARRFHDASVGAQTRIGLGPVGVTYTKSDMMTKIAKLADEYGCGLHTHLHPRPDEREKAKQYLDCGPVDFLARAGWLRPGTWFAHCSQLTDDEMGRFADNGVGIAHCPRAIPRLGFPLTRIAAMRERGVTVGLGVDGSASNDSGSILNDLRLALILHRIGTPPGTDTDRAWLAPYDALLMATRNGARILGRDDIGSLEPGKMADLAAFKLDRVGYAGCVSDPLGALLLAGSDPYADLTMVGGRTVVRDGKLVSDDEPMIVERANAAARLMLERSRAHATARF
jgi:8-oxoguanine deaminase